MHGTSIREVEPERDASEIVELIRETDQYIVISEESWLHRARTVPERAERKLWAAERDGRVVGYSFAFRNFFTVGSTSVFGGVDVSELHRRRGIGTALHDRVVEHARALEARSLVLGFVESPVGVAFLTRLGYREARAEQESVLDPRTVLEQPPAGLDVRRVSDVDPRDVFHVDLTATRDVPLLEPIDDVSYDEWADHVLSHPHFTAEGSFVAYSEGRPAAVSILLAHHESGRAANMFTGTLAHFRGRGLAFGVKLASIAWARECGITSLATTNDERNAPMLAINRKLGYKPTARRVEYLREAETGSAPVPRAPAR